LAVNNGFYSSPVVGGSNPNYILTPSSSAVHRIYIAIFQDLLQQQQGRNPALALQAIFTILTQRSYYDFLPQFDLGDFALWASSETVNIPDKWLGLTIVLIGITAHLAVLIVVTTVFYFKTNVSILGNAWHAVARTMTEDTMSTLSKADFQTDDHVERLLKASGRDQKVADSTMKRMFEH
jgi:hypothetical protein